jgi:hypothetical protein
MSHDSEIQPVEPNKNEFKDGLALFEKSLKAYQQSSMEDQKAQFKSAMGRACKMLTEKDSKSLSASDKEQLAQLQADFKAFNTNPSSDLMRKLQSDINALKGLS